MYDLNHIQFEIDSVRNTQIRDRSELEMFREKYLSKSGILPKIYKSVLSVDKKNQNQYLMKMIDLRHSVDDVIRKFEITL